MQMRFSNKKCDKCGKSYDPALKKCPHCNEENPGLSRKLYPVNDPAPVLKEILFFGIGCFGLQIIATLIALIAGKFLDPTSLEYKTIGNYTAYGVLFLILSLLVFSYWKSIGKVFLNKRTYLGIAVGIVLIGFNLAYSAILSHAGIGSNENQKDLIEVVTSSPALGVILLGIIGPICEEITYRLGLFDLLKRAHIAIAYVACAIIFGFIHFDFTNPTMVEWLNIPNYVICGAILCFANDRLGIGASMIAHVMNNMLSIVMIII